MLPDFNRLKVFYHIYTRCSVASAAKDLHLSQPAVSQQLQKLEAELKVPLFTRLHKKLVPTAAAIRLFQTVRPFVDELQTAVDNIRQPLDRPSGNLRVGAPREFGKEFLPRLCSSFRKTYPEVSFSLKFEETIPLLAMLEEGKLDFALVDIYQSKGPFFSGADIFSVEAFINEEVILACAQQYYQREINGDHSFKNLVGKEFISDEEDLVILLHWFRHHFNKTAGKLNIVLTIDSHEALISAVKLGMGLGIVSAHLVWDEIRAGSIIQIVTEKQSLLNRISLIQLQDKIPTLTEKTFLQYLKKGMQAPEVLRKFGVEQQIPLT